MFRVPYNVLNILRMFLEYTDTFKLLVIIIAFPDPDALIPGTGSEVVAIMGPTHTFHFVLMAFDDCQQGPFGIVLGPYRNGGIKRTTR
jgi:hypothetical protein